jgi:hypothetical protein
MTATMLASRAAIAGLALTAMGLVAASPAAAHTNNIYEFIQYNDTTSDVDTQSFATIGRTDGVATSLPTSYVNEFFDLAGAELFDERGTFIDNDGEEAWYLHAWNHITGEIGLPLELYVDAEDSGLTRVVELDTLNDGTTITFAEYFIANGTSAAIMSIDLSSGELTELVSLSDLVYFETQYLPTGIATDPLTGVTYVFLINEVEQVFFITLDVAAHTHSAPVQFTDASFAVGVISGVDFDADGTLWFNYFDNTDDEFTFSKLSAPSTWPSAARTQISELPANSDEYQMDIDALTIEHIALANTGTELPIAAIVLVGSVALVAGGVTVMVARRRSERGTV